MIRIYGMPSCPDCAYIEEQIAGREDEFDYIDIGSHIKLLKEFLSIRDREEAFLSCKEKGQAGIPCFVLENGRVTLDAEEAGLKNREVEETGANACSFIPGGSSC